jgi:hypothetical protein
MTDEPQIIQCPSCFGTGRNRHGGPCRRCRATGRIEQYGFYVPAGAGCGLVIRSVRRLLGADPDTGLRRPGVR